MSNTIRNQAQIALVLLLLLIAMPAWAQTPLASKFAAGSSLRYEFEGLIHLSTEHSSDVQLKAPVDCSYELKAVLKFDFEKVSTEGALTGRVSFQGVQADIPECANPAKLRTTEALNDFATHGTEFVIHPAGDVRLAKPFSENEPEIVSILRKAAWDLLQVKLADGAIAPNSPGKASKRFLYWPDTYVDGMDIAAASIRYERDVKVGTANCALLAYKQVFSPTDLPAYVDARTRARDFTGTSLITGRGSISLLWNPADQRVVYLHRRRTIDNRLDLKYDGAEENRTIARVVVEEESTARLLLEKNSEAWLAELHHFEASADQPSPAAVAAVRQQQNVEHREISDLLDRLPRGFERWRRNFCDGQFCFELSVAVPEGARVVESGGPTTFLISASGERTISVAVGPILDPQRSGLDDEQLLRQQISRFTRNNLWFAAGTGEPLDFTSEALHDRPAGFANFSAKARDLSQIRGQLVMVITPYGRLAPVACAYPDAQPDLDSLCQTVTNSVAIQ